MSDVRITKANWTNDKSELQAIRHAVFVIEQNVPQTLEWDDKDEASSHFLAFVDDVPAGCARLVHENKIGRMAILPQYRGYGLGLKLLEFIKEHAQSKGTKALELSAQCQASQFYFSAGYSAFSTPYDDANIPHIDMRRDIQEKPTESQGTEAHLFLKGKDSDFHNGNTPIEVTGYLDLILSQTQSSIILSIRDLSHSLTRHTHLLEKITQLAKRNRHFKVLILLSGYHPQYNDHPLIKLKNRLPSFLEIRVTEESVPNQWIFDGVAWFDYEGGNCRSCFNDRSRVRLFMERFNDWWSKSKIETESRILSI